MKSMSAKEAKNGFGLLLDTARAEPVTIEKHGRPVVVVLSTEEYDRLLSGSSRKKSRLGRTDDEVVDRQLKRDRTGKA
ncbi:type II toxin-antitoxin system Phd/YefM family antitoxin [Hyphococcus sp.]|uniref:type II toxin-antitoxin system Phd/YefM family antitoxin n=1 Tax=Hyphococcus sp. TaxID=2038636 RepID=UPI0035C75C44